MAIPTIPSDFAEFLRLLTAHGAEYLVVGGYAVSFHGYPRATVDLDIWVRNSPSNADKLAKALREFGFDVPELSPDLFLTRNRVVRMGVPPLRIEIMTSVSGVDFDSAYRDRVTVTVSDVAVSFIGLKHLKENKLAAGRHKDLNDLEHLP